MPMVCSRPVVTGVGVVSPVGQGKDAFLRGLLNKEHGFDVMRRPGRQHATSAFLGAEVVALRQASVLSRRMLRSASLAAQFALAAVEEAWLEAGLQEIEPARLGLVIGGSNVQQRELALTQNASRDRVEFLRPTYGLSFMDTDLCGLCTMHFGIRGMAFTTGGASASGQLAIIQAAQAVREGRVDACIAVGSLADLSYWECQGLRALGAMGSDRFASTPELACRPFDRDHDGFIYGEMCGAVVIEREDVATRRGRTAYAVLSGTGMAIDGNRNPDPSLEGEVRAINMALDDAGCAAASIDYVNPHGTGSIIGDETELRALHECGLENARLNATKAIIGHGLSAAGTVEVVATLLQMRASKLHPTRNLDDPIVADMNWVGEEATAHTMNRALTMSIGFGGIDTALCWQSLQ